MKKITLTKEIFLTGGASVILSSCGGGNTNSSIPYNQPSNLLSTPIYDTKWNTPYVVIYINNQPVKLMLDTGASGILVEQSAINLPAEAYTSYTFHGQFGDGTTYFGTVASATVCLNPSLTQSCVTMPIGVQTGGTSEHTWSSLSLNGGFGSANALNVIALANNTSGQNLYVLSYQHYLYQQNNTINSFTLSFSSMSSPYEIVSPNTPIGTLSFGAYNDVLNNLIPVNDVGETSLTFPSFTSSLPSYTVNYVMFDTGTPIDLLNPKALSTEIPNFSTGEDVDNCPYFGSLTSGLSLSYIATHYFNSFTTSFDYNTCMSLFNNSLPYDIIFTNDAVDDNDISFNYNVIGFSDFLNHNITYIAHRTGNNAGLTKGFVFNK